MNVASKHASGNTVPTALLDAARKLQTYRENGAITLDDSQLILLVAATLHKEGPDSGFAHALVEVLSA